MTILLTGTHLTPAIATIQALKKKAPGARLVYVGRKHTGAAESVEREEIERVGAEFVTVESGKFHRWPTWKILAELLKIPAGIWQAFGLIKRYKPDIVVSFGGYSSVPVVLAGKIGGARIVIHEQTTVWGAANRLMKGLADAAAVSWKNMEEPGVVWTGNPIREEVLTASVSVASLDGISSIRSARNPRSLRRRFLVGAEDKVLPSSSSMISEIPSSARSLSFCEGFPVLYITGGNQGARAIDRVVEKILPDLVEKFEVFHQTKSKIGFNHPRYHTAEWFSTPVHAEILSRAAVSVSRAGANTVTELMYLEVPAILVPLPGSAGGEQDKNAEILVRAGLGRVIKQEELTSARLLSEITDKSYKNYKDYKRRGEKGEREQKDEKGEGKTQKDQKEKGNTAADQLAELILGEKE